MVANQLALRSGSQKAGEGESYYVSNVYNHPKYNSETFDFDFSLLKIFGKIFYNVNQRAIKLPDEDDETPAGEFARTLGWGKTMNPDESSEYLRGVELMVITPDECEEAYKEYQVDVEANKVCAVHPERIDGKDACQGGKVYGVL